MATKVLENLSHNRAEQVRYIGRLMAEIDREPQLAYAKEQDEKIGEKREKRKKRLRLQEKC